jgi:cardiolipin synthase (CMP-forming)
MFSEPSRGGHGDPEGDAVRSAPVPEHEPRQGLAGGGAASGSSSHHIRRTLGWTHWPSYIWRPVPLQQGRAPGGILSVLHTGYAFSALALIFDGFLWLGPGFPAAALFLLGHLLWISLIVSLLLFNSAFLQRLDGSPLDRLGLANLMTVTRIFLLPLLLYLLVRGFWLVALIGYTVLGLTDVIDGAVARRRKEESKLGFVLDPFADILFHLGILVSLSAVGILSWWTAALVLVRYGLLLTGSLVLYHFKGEIWIQPTPFGKATGLAISFLTGTILLRLAIGGDSGLFLTWCDGMLRFFFAACVMHVLIIGRINYLRPTQGGSAVYRRGWGLLVGHRARPGQKAGLGPDVGSGQGVAGSGPGGTDAGTTKP